VPIAKQMNWGIAGQDPAWPYPPVLHDYVSFRWMLRRARRAHPNVEASAMSFYPSVDAWLAAKNRTRGGPVKQLARRALRHAGRIAPLNYYFGEKVIFSKRVAS
jgi:hypothetical protein